MAKITTNDPETLSADVVAENVNHLKVLFPEAFTEGKVDFEVLKQLLGGEDGRTLHRVQPSYSIGTRGSRCGRSGWSWSGSSTESGLTRRCAGPWRGRANRPPRMFHRAKDRSAAGRNAVGRSGTLAPAASSLSWRAHRAAQRRQGRAWERISGEVETPSQRLQWGGAFVRLSAPHGRIRKRSHSAHAGFLEVGA